MKTFGRFFAGVVLALALAPCCGASSLATPFQPPQGLLFSKQRAPLQVNGFRGAALGTACGQASCTGFFQYQVLWFSWGDCSLDAAVRDGGLARVDYADYEYVSVFNGFFSKTTVYVYGPKK